MRKTEVPFEVVIFAIVTSAMTVYEIIQVWMVLQ